MKRAMVFGWGYLLVFMGVALLLWIGYNLFVEMQPEAEGLSPRAGFALAVGMIGVGIARIRSQLRKRDNMDPKDLA